MPTVSFTGRACISASIFSPSARAVLQGLNGYTYGMAVGYDSGYLNYNSILPYFRAGARIRATVNKSFTSRAALLEYIQGQYAIYRAGSLTYDASGAIYNNVSPFKTFSARASLIGLTTITMTMRSRVQRVQTQTIQTRAYIVRVADLQMRAMMSQTSTKTFTAKAKIAIRYTKSITIGMRIGTYYLNTLDAKAYIVQRTNQSLTAQAQVAKTQTTTFTSRARVQRTETKTFTSRATIGDIRTQSFTAQANIVLRSTTSLTAQARIQATQTKTLTIRGTVIKTITESLSSRATIGDIRNKSFTALARISVKSTKTFTAQGRIIRTYVKTFTMRGRVSRQGLTTFTSKARVVRLYTFTTQARLIATLTKALTSRARILRYGSTTLGMRGALNFRVELTAGARIQNTYTLNLTSRGTIQVTSLVSIAARAYIIILKSMTMRGTIRRKQFRGLYIKSRIVRPVTTTFTARARMNSTLREFTMMGTITRDLFIRARISRKQGWPLPNPDDLNYTTFVDTRLTIRAKIKGPNRYTQTIQSGANILWLRTVGFTAKAEVRPASYIAARANIVPRVYRTTFPVTFTVAEQGRRVARMVFYVRGNQLTQALSARAHITRPGRTTATMAFSVATDMSSHLQTLYVAVTERSVQQLGARARIE